MDRGGKRNALLVEQIKLFPLGITVLLHAFAASSPAARVFQLFALVSRLLSVDFSAGVREGGRVAR